MEGAERPGVEHIILDLVRLLRQAGHAISQSEVRDCLDALRGLPREIPKSALCGLLNATLLKAEWGEGYLERLLDLYSEAQLAAEAVSAPASSVMGTGLGSVGAGEASQRLLDVVRSGSLELMSAVIRAMELGADLLSEDREASLARLKEASGWFLAARTVDEDFRRGHLSPGEYERSRRALEHGVLLLAQEMDRVQVRRLGKDHLLQVMKRHDPRQVAFQEADARMLGLMATEVAKLARKLAVRRGRRRKAGLRGRMDLRRITRQAMQTGGVPLCLCQTGRKLAKPDLWLLCDVSNSVRQFSYFMLLLVHTIQNRFAHIRSFLFVDRVLEVSASFRQQDWGGLDHLSGHSMSGFSHYGEVLRRFGQLAEGQLGADTTLIILGDAKNNWNRADGAESLGALTRQAKAVHWLNPMKAELWDRDDCVMGRYLPHCTDAFPCSNLEELEKVVLRIL